MTSTDPATDCTISYTKLRDGSWGLRGHRLSAGARVVVRKRDGSTKEERVGRVLWTGADGVTLATIDGGQVSPPRRGGGPNWDADAFAGYGRPRGAYRKACVTGGNCSSFGSGKSCGGFDCDGF